MKVKLLKSILTALSLICILCIPITPVYAEPQGTDGTEIQVVKAEKLEIQLGPEWAGVEFQMKTDAGMYPGTITVGDDGVLRAEIGGSTSYILTCMNSSVSAPEPTQVLATTEQPSDGDSDKAVSDVEIKPENTVAGIPVQHIVLFGGGMVIAIGGLVVMQVMKKRRETDMEYEDDEDEDESSPY